MNLRGCTEKQRGLGVWEGGWGGLCEAKEAQAGYPHIVHSGSASMRLVRRYTRDCY